MTALRHAPELRGCFRFDEMLRVPVLVRPLPKGKPGVLPRPVRDTDVSIVQEWLQRNELRRLGKDIVHQAVALRAEENAFHPVRDYLNGLRWDRKPRLSTWLTYYAGVEPDEKLSDEEKADQRQYISAIGRMFLISYGRTRHAPRMQSRLHAHPGKHSGREKIDHRRNPGRAMVQR